MILYLDIRRDIVTLALLTPAALPSGRPVKSRGRDRWFSMKGDNKVGMALAKANHVFGFKRKKPAVIVVAMNAAGVTQEQRNVTWSGIRQGVATANALAFAWGVPVSALSVRGDESRGELPALVREASKSAKAGEWVRAEYSAEPNITKAKKVL